MADRVATSDDTLAGGAPAAEALRAVRKARRELLAVLAPLVIAAVAVVVAAGIFFNNRLAGGTFAFSTLATAALPAVGMLALFYTLSHDSTQNRNLHISLAVLFGITAVGFALAWLEPVVFASESASVFPLGVVLAAQLAAMFPSTLLGFRLLSMRGKRHDMLFGEASSPPPSRRRLKAAAWMAVAGIAIALSLAVTIPIAVVEVASLPVSADAARGAEFTTRGTLITSLQLTPAWLMILLLPLALLAGDTYQHRRRQAGLGPDSHLARASRVIFITLAVIGVIAVLALGTFWVPVTREDILLSLLDWLGVGL